MDLTNYLNKRVHIITIKGYTYIGKVIYTDNNSIRLIDKKGHDVSLKENVIETIMEVELV